jgi:hypothetical protein
MVIYSWAKVPNCVNCPFGRAGFEADLPSVLSVRPSLCGRCCEALLDAAGTPEQLVQQRELEEVAVG